MKKLLYILLAILPYLGFSQAEIPGGYNVKAADLLDFKGKITLLQDTSLILADSGQQTYVIDLDKFYYYDGSSWSVVEAGIDSTLLWTQYDQDTLTANALNLEVDSFDVNGKWLYGDIIEYDKGHSFTGLQIPDYQTVKDAIHDSVSINRSKWDEGMGDVIYYSDSVGIGTSTPSVLLDVAGDFDCENTASINDVSKDIATEDLTFGGDITFEGGLIYDYVIKTANYTVTVSDYIIEVSTTAITLTFPAGVLGQEFVVINTSVGMITIDGDGTEEIGNTSTALTYTMPSGEGKTFIYNGTYWRLKNN